MARHFTGDHTHLGSVRRHETELCSYRFGRRREGHARSPSALHRANSYLKAFVQSIADAKFRRMLRELELRGTRLDTRDELWVPDELRDLNATK
jgi:hypothetical protein